jgi:hypothetical protein
MIHKHAIGGMCTDFETQICSSKESIQLQRKNVMAFKRNKVC